MTKFKSDIADSASAMMQLPNTLEGMLQDIHDQVAVSPAKADEDDNEPSAQSLPKHPLSTPQAPPKHRRQKKAAPTDNATPAFVAGDELWTAFCTQCTLEDQSPKTIGKDGTASFCKLDKDILATFRKWSVAGYSTQTMVNAILRSFILHYKKEFNAYRVTEKSLL